jgi:hypothetical protein
MSRRALDRLAAALFAIALPMASSAQTEELQDAPTEPIRLENGAVVYPQGAAPRLRPRSGYGTDDLHVVNIPFHSFLPLFSAVSYASQCCVTDAARWPTGGQNFLLASLDAGLLPNGARIEEVRFYIGDSNGGIDMNFEGRLCRSWIESTGANPGNACLITLTSFGNPGDTVLSGSLAATVRYQADVGSDGDLDAQSYILLAEFGINGQTVYDGTVRLRQVEILFRRQISPAPVSATFNDVGTGDFGFQQIEALVASGITAGCGGGAFCPNASLTRAQMAVFLAKALGLHWPALF